MCFLEQGNNLATEMKKMKVTLRQIDNIDGQASNSNFKRLTVFKCKAYLPLTNYDDLLAFEATLTGEVEEDFVSDSSKLCIFDLKCCFFNTDQLPYVTWWWE